MRPTPAARARSITRASVPRRHARMTSWPARSSSTLTRAAQYASDDQPRQDTIWSTLMRGRAAAPGPRDRSPPPGSAWRSGLNSSIARRRPASPMRRARAGSAASAASARSTDSGRSSSSEEPGLAVLHRVRQGADPPGHHRPARRHRLQRGPARLVGARAHEDEGVEGAQDGGQVAVAIAGEDHLALQPQLAHQRLEARPRLALADEEEARARIAAEQPLEAVDEQLVAAVVGEPRDRPDDGAGDRGARRGRRGPARRAPRRGRHPRRSARGPPPRPRDGCARAAMPASRARSSICRLTASTASVRR